MENKPIDYIIWDWNGTLLDDSEISLMTMNRLLEKYHLKKLSREKYMDVFTFPVVDYYKLIGFELNKTPFEELSVAYIKEYNSLADNCKLTQGSEKALKEFEYRGIPQILLSASETDALLGQVYKLGVDKYFKYIIGSDNIHAHGKAQMAVDFIKKHNLNGKNGVLIGDTLHDYETACAIGCKCILCFSGHQSMDRLKKCGVPVVESLLEVVELLCCNRFNTV